MPLIAQNQTAKWYFGSQAGLDFMTNPPTILTNGVLATTEGCSSISDASGNLLFYTDGMTVYNSAHTFMANGTGLNGQWSPAQSSIIIRRPGSQNIYYIFTVIGMCGTNGSTAGAYYSIVDMSLAAGQGSVTVKNATLTTAIVSEKITGTRHCNGVDYWVVVEDFQNNISPAFKSYLLTSTGINTVAVTSAGPSSNNAFCGGCMKISPNGKKLAWANYGWTNLIYSRCNLFDFDNSTGVVSNSISLSTNTPSLNILGCYGVEFSPDGTKLFGTHYFSNGPFLTEGILQWDICAPSTAAIVASKTVLAVQSPTTFGYHSLQRASNGKIYVARGQFALGVISNPNAYGAACNYVDLQQSLGPNITMGGLPNFLGSDFNPPPASLPPFTFTASNSLGCQTASFTAPPIVQNFTVIACAPNGYSVTNMVWNFGDPNSGAANTATLANPSHVFSAPGTYSTSLIVYYSCGGGTDTLQQVVNVLPCISVQSQSISCASLGSATVSPINGTGPLTYTWMPSAQNGAIANGLIPGTYTVYFNDPNNNQTYTHTLTLISSNQMSCNLANSSSVNCQGASNGTASVFNISGGSGTQTYFWTNGTQTLSVANPTNLSAGIWSLTVTDALTACQINSVFTITQPPALSLAITASNPTTCVGTGITFTAVNSGGIPGGSPAYTYTWTGGPNTDTNSSVQYTAGNYIYTVQSGDANNCLATQTIAVNWVPNPVLSVSDVSICPLEVGTFTVSGAASYTWQASTSLSLTGSSFTDSPISSTTYTVIGEALSCTAAATASIILKPTPNPVISHNSPVCENGNLLVSVSSATAAVWSGPSAFASVSISNTLSNVQLNQGGVYDVTITALNSCTATASASLTVNPLPQFSIAPSSSSICANTTSVTLSVIPLSLSFSLSTYSWYPSTILSTSSGTLTNAYPPSTSIYTVIGSLNACTNSAQTTVNVLPPPSLTGQFNSPTLCSQAFNGSPNTITLTAGGANTYSLVTIPDMFNANPGGPVSPLTSIPPYTGAGSATLSGSNGVCTVTVGLTFTILPNPNVTVNDYTPVICAGETFTYTNQGASTYTWSSATPGSTIISNGGVAVTSPTINSVFSVFGGSLGCNSALHTSTITVNPLPTVQISPDPLKMCLGDTLPMFAQSNATAFQWYPPYGLSSYTTQQVSTHINQNQHYTVVATLNSCSNTAVAMVSIMPLPLPQILPVKDEVCLYESIQLNGQGGIYYEWRAPNLQTYTIQNLELGISHLSLAGSYTLKIADANGCSNYSTHPVVVHNLPQGSLIPKQREFCVPYCNSFTFVSNTQSSISEAGPWTLNSLLFTGNSFTSCFTNTGEFQINGPIVDEFGCKNTVQVQVIGRPKPVADFYTIPEHPVEGMDGVTFVNVTSNIVGYSWQASGLVSSSPSTPLGMTTLSWMSFNSTESRPTYRFEEAGIYGLMLMVKNEFNCWDTVMKTIRVESDFTAYIPNAFTPNADGLNDTFYPVLRGVKKLELQIYDRWGELIFVSSDVSQAWDGTFRGQECKQDVYNYKLVLLNVKGEEKVYAGTVMLYR